MEKHCPLKLKDQDDFSRIKQAVQQENQGSLGESFNLQMYQQPTWKIIEKEKWKTFKGMSYSGQPAAHTCKTRIFGGSKQVELSMTANNQ
jgi:hypothetical protein